MLLPDATTCERDLIRRDPLLPGLATVLEPNAFCEALRVALPNATITNPELTYLRYKPHTNCLVGYRLIIDGIREMLYATAYPEGEEKPYKALGIYSNDRPPLVLERGVVVRTFPTDRKLTALARIAADAPRAALLASALPEHPELWNAQLNVMRYKPERRLVAQLITKGEPQAVLKLYSEGDFDRAYRGARAFRPVAEATASLGLASLLGRSKRQRLLVTKWVPGRPFDGVLCAGEANAGHQVGVALACLHDQTPEQLVTWSREDELRQLFAAAEAVAFLLPALAPRSAQLARRLASGLGAALATSTPVHGDFSADQALLTASGAALIDLDGAAFGDAAGDLGSFAAQLEYDVLSGSLPEDTAAGALEALLEGYREGRSYHPASVALYTAAGLLRLAPQPFRTRSADWPAQTEALLERAEALLTRRTTRRVTARAQVRDAANAFADPALAFAKEALAPDIVGPQLYEVLAKRGIRNAQLSGVEVLRHKPGRRSLIAYDLQASTGPVRVLGKVRVKGTDVRTQKLQTVLWEGGFGADSPDGIHVAEPLGVLEPFHMTLQRAVPGVSAHTLIACPQLTRLQPEQVMARIAEAAYKLHQAGVVPDRVHSVRNELMILEGQLARVVLAHPHLAQRLERVLEGCRTLAQALPEPRAVGLHRDFYPEQILVNSGQRGVSHLYLLDLDLYALGDPALDLGNFVGHLTEQALRTKGDALALQPHEEALTKRYRELSETSQEVISAYSTLTLARHIAISQRVPGRRSLTEPLLELTETRLERDLTVLAG